MGDRDLESRGPRKDRGDLGRAWTRRGRVNLTAELSDERFLSDFDSEARHWLVEGAIAEFAADLDALHERGADYAGPADRPRIGTENWASEPARQDGGTLLIDGQQVMQDWELPLMKRMVERTAAPGHHVLEVGFGMGLSATMIQQAGVASHTIIECNADVLDQAASWRSEQIDPGAVHIIDGMWQDALPVIGQFDGVLFDTYPVSEMEFIRASIVRPYPEDFFEAIVDHLTTGGVVAYYTNEIDSLSRGHQRALLKSFEGFFVEVVRDLRPPADCNYWWASSMAVVTAYGENSA